MNAVSILNGPAVAPEVPAAGPPGTAVGAGALLRRRLLRDRPSVAALAFLAILLVAATAGAPLVAHLTGHAPTEQFVNALDFRGRPVGPLAHEYLADGVTPDTHGQLFVLGADQLGRDLLVRLLYGARISLLVGFGSTALAMLVGVALGMIAAWRGGLTDAVVSRAVELGMAFPALLLAIALAVVLGAGLLNVIVVIAVFSWYYPARIARAIVRSVRSQPYIEAARSIGATNRRILLRHVAPQLATPMLVYASTVIAGNILFEAGLSYLGLGVPPPNPSWGGMLADSVVNGLYRVKPHLALVPGIALGLTLLALNLLADGVRDAAEGRSG